MTTERFKAKISGVMSGDLPIDVQVVEGSVSIAIDPDSSPGEVLIALFEGPVGASSPKAIGYSPSVAIEVAKSLIEAAIAASKNMAELQAKKDGQ